MRGFKNAAQRCPEGQQPPVLFPNQSDAQLTLNIWDFGGQDLYHNTHRLFMETQAVFIVVERWKDPNKPRRPQNPTDIDRPLQYWLEQVAAATAGSQHKPRVLIVRTAIDDQTQKPFALDPWQERVKTKFHYHRYFELSCLDNQRDTEAWKTFRSTLLEQIRETLGGAESKSILQPRGRVAVRQKLRAGQPACNEPRTSDDTAAPMLLLHQFHDLVRQTFQEHGLPEPNKAELDGQLDFFHQRGVVYAPPSWLQRHSTPSAFPVIVDQLWLIEGIYQFISTQSLRDDWIVQCGKVTRDDLDSAWDQLQRLEPTLRLDPEARWAMLACMENFGLLVSTQADEEWTGILPEFLPQRRQVLEGQAQHNDPVIGEWKVQQKRCYRLQDTALGMGIGCQLIGWLISTFGQSYRLYRFGALVTLQVYSSESAESRQVRVELRWEKDSEDNFAGDLWLWLPADCGVEAEVLCYLEEQLQRRQLVRKGTQFAPQPSRDPSARAQPTPYIHYEPQQLPKRGGQLPGQDTGTTVRPVYTLGRVGISWAGGAPDSEQEFWPPLIDQMLRERSQGKFDVVQYKKTEDCKQTTHEMLQNLAEADLLIAVISDKYLNSAYCMVELLQAARKWSTDNDQGAPVREWFPANISQWLPRIWFVFLRDAKWILDSDEGAVDQWAAKRREEGLLYCLNYDMNSADGATARKHSAATDVRDAWMRFAAADVNNPKQFRAVLKPDAPRTTVSMELVADPQLRDDKGRADLKSFIDKVIPAIFERIDGMQPPQKIERCIKIAKRHYFLGKYPDAWAWVTHCLKYFPNPQEMSQQLHDDETVPPELSELKPLLPAWREHIGVTRPPASP